MKQLLVILSLVLISSGLLAQSGDYIKTNDGTHFFKKIKTKTGESFTGFKDNGEKMKFDKEEIVAYVINGEYFQKMPVYENNVFTGDKDFMKLVETKKGMVLLEYKYVSKTSNKKATKYFVFKDQQLVVEMDDKNKQTLTAFFDVY